MPVIKSTILSILLLCVVFCLFDSCQVKKIEKNFDPQSIEFLSVAKYIMTNEEHKRFAKLPVPERDDFIEEFWKRRDPNPDTEENEFKEAYLARFEEAMEIFSKGAAKDLTDRGMIFVLFGPPDYVYHSPVSRYDRGKNYEKWTYIYLFEKYNNVDIFFINRFGSSSFSGPFNFGDGRYELDRSTSSVFSLIQEAKERFIEHQQESKLLKYDLSLKTLEKEEDRVKLLIQINIPYKNIWFSKEKDKMETTFSVDAKILDAAKNKIWEHQQDYQVTIPEKEVEELLKVKKGHVIEIPTNLSNPSKGKYLLRVIITDKTEGEKEEKVHRFNL